MKLVYRDFETPIIYQDYFNLLVLENHELFFQFHQDLFDLVNGIGAHLQFFDNNSNIDFKKYGEWLVSPWILSLSDRKITNRLYEHLETLIGEKNIDTNIVQLLIEIESLLHEVIDDEPLVKLNEESIAITQLLKFFEVKFDTLNDEDLLNKLMDYILIKAQYENKKIFILDQFEGYLNNNSLNEIAQFCRSEKLFILLLESSVSNQLDSFLGRHVVIDNDLCEIILKS